MKILSLILIISLISNGFAYIITVDSHSEECFFDKAEAGAKLGELQSAKRKFENFPYLHFLFSQKD
jgi:hypothetical protein